MEFNIKIQELRKQKGLTQEELAAVLYVSRAAVSKWESGRGYPSIDSLKAIASFFGTTIDELLSGGELLSLAESESRQKELHIRDLVFGLLDCSIIMFFFLPFFRQVKNGGVQEVTLLALTEIENYMRTAYIAVVISIAAAGILSLSLQNIRHSFWVKNKHRLSLFLSSVGGLLFIFGLQPYAAVFLLLFLAIKVLITTK